MRLVEYVMANTTRGDCTCGKCIDSAANLGLPEQQPSGHTINMTFFKVAAGPDAKKEALLELVQAEHPAYLDGQEHNYTEIGADLGDQGIAIMLIGLGHLLGAWQALVPETVMPFLDDGMKTMLAERGMLVLKT